MNDWRLFVGGKAAGALICIHFCIVLRLRMSEATQLLPICLRAVRRSDFILLWLIHSMGLIPRKVVVTRWPNSRLLRSPSAHFRVLKSDSYHKPDKPNPCP